MSRQPNDVLPKQSAPQHRMVISGRCPTEKHRSRRNKGAWPKVWPTSQGLDDGMGASL